MFKIPTLNQRENGIKNKLGPNVKSESQEISNEQH